MLHYIHKFVNTGQEEVEDVLQECYIRLWENMDTITDHENIIPLLRTYAINFSINQLQKYVKQQQREKAFYDQRALTTDTLDDLHITNTLQEFNQVVESLPPQRKLVYRIVRERGLSYREISAQLGISPNTIERHINEALRTIHTRFPADKLAGVILLIGLKSKMF